MIKLFKISILIIIIYPFILKGDDSYPYSYILKEYNPEGQLLLNKSEGNLYSYYFKYNLASNTEVIYKWKGLERSDAVGESFGSILVLDQIFSDGNLLLCYEDEGVVKVSLVDKDLNLLDSAGLKINILAGEKFEAEWKGKVTETSHLLQAGEYLYLINIENNKLDYHFISEKTVDAESYYEFDNNDSTFAYIIDKEGNLLLFYGDWTGQSIAAARMQHSDNTNLKLTVSSAVILSEYQSQTLVQIHQKITGISSVFWLNTITNNISLKKQFKNEQLIFLEESSGNYHLKKRGLFDNIEKTEKLSEVPKGLIEPIAFIYEDGLFYIFFRNGLITYNDNFELISKDFINFGNKINNDSEIINVENNIVITSNIGTLILEIEENEFWLITRFIRTTGDILIPVILILFLLLFVQLYRHQKRLLKTVLELPQAGFIYVIDKAGNLIRANDFGRKILKLSSGVTLRKRFSYYCNQSENAELKRVFEKAIVERITYTEKINLPYGEDEKEILCTATILRNITGNFRGIVLTGVDITEELERKRLTNWAQLAHDMQTNLSTIRLNAEQIEVNGNNFNNERRFKIVNQVNLLMQRVRDIVTVGREDELDLTTVMSDELCVLVRNEIDELLYPDVKIELKISTFQFYCDKQKMIRAIRNAVENAIKSIKDKQGLIILSCYKDARNVYFSIKDNGIGMNEETKKKMLNPYFTTRKGSGGSGIGTMIMKKVTELHDGKINIKSEQGEGTEIIFEFPLIKKQI